MKKLIVLSLAITLSACVNMDETVKNMFNVPSSGESKFDGTKFVRVSAIPCDDVMFELYQQTEQAERGVVLLTAGPYHDIENIAKGESLSIKLDGVISNFESQDAFTHHGESFMGKAGSIRFSSKTYVVPESFVEQAALAKEFYVRLSLLNNSYVEGQCSPHSDEELAALWAKQGMEISQKDIDRTNSYVGIVGFQKFVALMKGL